MKSSAFRGLKLPDVHRMSVSDFRAYAAGKPVGDKSKPTLVTPPKSKAEADQAEKRSSAASTKVSSSRSSAAAPSSPTKKTAKAQPPGKPVEKATPSARMSLANYRKAQSAGGVIRLGEPNKMGARRVYTEEGVFDSIEEHKRWVALKLLLAAGVISDLRRQVDYSLDLNGIHICKYRADYVYISEGAEVVEDVKGFKTPEYLRKKRLMKEILGIEIFETGKSTSRGSPKPRKPRRA